ncbi:MAG: hypothetical protein IJW16_02095 [Clostridia bacterium]|nr:hypothetical protein [Clostridia bacterium]
MKCYLRRDLEQLSPSSQKRVAEAYDRQLEQNMNVMLDIFLKMSCAVLHDSRGMTEEELYAYLGNYRQLFRRHQNMVRAGTQLEELDRKMREIFPASGYPDDFFKSMIHSWEVETGKNAASGNDVAPSANDALCNDVVTS